MRSRRNPFGATGASWVDASASGEGAPGALAVAPPGARLSPAQQQFNELVQRIAQLRAQLAEWQAAQERYHQRVRTELEPLYREVMAHRRSLALLIGVQLETLPARGPRSIGRSLRNKLTHLMLNLAQQCLEEAPGADAELEALFDRYSDVSHADLRAEDMAATEAMLSALFGVELEAGHGARTVDELMQHAAGKISQEMQREAERKQERRAERQARKQARQQAKAAQQAPSQDGGTPGEAGATAPRSVEQMRQDASQSLRAVYRKLASALHPDREPDEQQRQRKTALMQRVNQAYDAGDLLTLLNLQLEVEQISPEHLGQVPPQRLAHYNQVLSEQLKELKDELESVMAPFRAMLDRATGWDTRPRRGRPPQLRPQQLEQLIEQEAAQLRADRDELVQDLGAFHEPANLRELMRGYEIEPAWTPVQSPFDAEPFDVFGEDNPFSSPRRKRR